MKQNKTSKYLKYAVGEIITPIALSNAPFSGFGANFVISNNSLTLH